MTSYKFLVKGHPNIKGTHHTTLEFTKNPQISERGDCIIGVSANFDRKKLVQFLSCREIKIIIKAGIHEETITARPNAEYNDDEEMVIRLGSFASERTFATDASKASKHLSRNAVAEIKENGAEVEIIGR